MTDNKDGWIEWKGGECPVEDRDIVEVMFRGYGEEHTDIAAAILFSYGLYDSWKHQPHPSDGSHDGDIVAYRIVAPLTYQHEDGKPAADMEDF